jgi:hypothetical protein
MRSKSIHLIASAAVLLSAALGCNLPYGGAPAATAPVAGSAGSAGSARPNETSAPAGVAVSFSGTSFTIPAGLATGAAPESVPAMDNEPVPSWELAPAFVQFTLQNYPVAGSLLKPMIWVYPAGKYEAVNNGAAESLKRLRALISGGGMDVNGQTAPFVPSFNATQSFVAQAMPIKFQNGAGIRMVTQYDQAPIPVNNHELVYHFEGLTSDGANYVIVVFPINAATLPADGNPASPVPAGGIPFNQDDPAAYFAAVSQSLNQAAPASFTPSLTALDALVESIGVVAP